MLPRSDRNWVEGLRRDGSVILSVRVFSRKKSGCNIQRWGPQAKCASVLSPPFGFLCHHQISLPSPLDLSFSPQAPALLTPG